MNVLRYDNECATDANKWFIRNGFQSIRKGTTQYLYCFDTEWVLGMPGYSVNPLDPELNIHWPILVSESDHDLISRKDATALLLKEVLEK